MVLNVNTVEAAGPGFVTVHPCASGRPNASNMNFVGGQIVPNLVIVQAERGHRPVEQLHGAVDGGDCVAHCVVRVTVASCVHDRDCNRHAGRAPRRRYR